MCVRASVFVCRRDGVNAQDLDEAGATWRNYFELIPSSWQFSYTRTKLENYFLFDDFANDAATGNLANYSECSLLSRPSSFFF